MSGGFWKRTILPRIVATGSAVVQDTELVVSHLVHALGQPIHGLIRGGEELITDARNVLGMGSSMVHLAMGAVAGYIAWEGLRMVSPSTSYRISDMVTRPFKRQRRMALDTSSFY